MTDIVCLIYRKGDAILTMNDNHEKQKKAGAENL